jgi:hypothetical protein
MNDSEDNTLIDYHDDNRVLRYLLQTVKGLSPVSGGVLGEALEDEYKLAEEEQRPDLDLEFDIEY